MANPRLSQIIIYPIKSLKGIQLKASEVEKEGLKYDRRWMLIDKDGVAITQRTTPILSRFTVEIQENVLQIYFGKEQRAVEITQLSTNPLKVQIWDDEVSAVEPSEKTSLWFSKMLGISCKLVSVFPETKRQIDLRFAKNGEFIRFADGFPVLLTTERSLNFLNNKLETPIHMERFRPNFVIEGALEPFEEDEWKGFLIGNHEFRVVKPCARCSMVSLNVETLEYEKEPLHTLNKFRSKNNKVYFGQNVIPCGESIVKIGDRVKVVYNS